MSLCHIIVIFSRALGFWPIACDPSFSPAQKEETHTPHSINTERHSINTDPGVRYFWRGYIGPGNRDGSRMRKAERQVHDIYCVAAGNQPAHKVIGVPDIPPGFIGVHVC